MLKFNFSIKRGLKKCVSQVLSVVMGVVFCFSGSVVFADVFRVADYINLPTYEIGLINGKNIKATYTTTKNSDYNSRCLNEGTLSATTIYYNCKNYYKISFFVVGETNPFYVTEEKTFDSNSEYFNDWSNASATLTNEGYAKYKTSNDGSVSTKKTTLKIESNKLIYSISYDNFVLAEYDFSNVKDESLISYELCKYKTSSGAYAVGRAKIIAGCYVAEISDNNIKFDVDVLKNDVSELYNTKASKDELSELANDLNSELNEKADLDYVNSEINGLKKINEKFIEGVKDILKLLNEFRDSNMKTKK